LIDGLCLLVRNNDSKLWRLAYRFEGRQKGLALGAYPEVTLAEARGRRDAARKLLANGKDPSLERRLDKMARAAGGNTFREVAEELLDKHRREEERSEATLKKNRWLLEPAYAAFGDRPAGEVTAPELLHALRTFEQRGRYESARRLRAYTWSLIAAAAPPGPMRDRLKQHCLVKGDPPSPVDPPPGCRFAQRCPSAIAQCRGTLPLPEMVEDEHIVACRRLAELVPPDLNASP
jgi:oligopeptide/dipeptide ABC transporter ATP-binding protein